MNTPTPDPTRTTSNTTSNSRAFTRGLAIAGLAGAALLGGALINPVASGAQESDTPAAEENAPDTTLDTPAEPDAQDEQGCEGEGRRHRGPNLEVAAEAIGMEVDELHEALEGGRTVAEVAEENGVDPQDVIDALVADVSDHLAQEVAEGDLTQEEADERLAEATQRITDGVTNGRPERPERPDGPRGERPDQDTQDQTQDA